MLIGVIPVRGGSRRLPGKNLKKLNGRSLLQIVIERAIAAGIFDRIIVSTEDQSLAEEALKFGAEVPFMRPVELATDSSSSVDVLIHAVESILNPQDFSSSVICLMQATSPLLRAEQIRAAYNAFVNGNYTSLSAMKEVSEYPEWMFRQGERPDDAKALYPDLLEKPGSSFVKRYVENGAFYFVKADWLIKSRSLYDLKNHGKYLIGRRESLDIDTQDDWDLAEFYLQKNG
ncbi:MAG: acylneuraminate cytidylyltransferase family protein [Candidatus Rifleibacteriota bacterium]